MQAALKVPVLCIYIYFPLSSARVCSSKAVGTLCAVPAESYFLLASYLGVFYPLHLSLLLLKIPPFILLARDVCVALLRLRE